MEKKKLGRFLESSSSISQIILAAVAIFAYFYTVRPIYQNQLLSEEISSKELELKKIRTDFKKGTQALETVRDSLEILKLEKDRLADIYNKKFQELGKRNSTLLNEVLQKERTVKEVQDNIIQLNIRNYIERIKSIAINEMYRLVDDEEEEQLNEFAKRYNEQLIEEAKKLVGNYKEHLIIFFRKVINISFGYGIDYGMKGLPDSVRIYLEEKSVKILDNNKSNIFNNYDVSKLAMALNRLNDVRKTCDTTDISREMAVIWSKINQEEVRNLEGLEKYSEELFDEQIDCIKKLYEPLQTFGSERGSIYYRGISEFVSLLYKELKYKEY